jgi:hypothetical protein
MPITFEISDIEEALSRFSIGRDDNYFLFDNNVLYIVWCVKFLKALDLAAQEECIDICINNEWVDYSTAVRQESPSPLVCVRYIIATN